MTDIQIGLARSRAVQRLIEPGSSAICTICGQPVKFAAKLAALQVIANVYVGGQWDRVEHFHLTCYDEAQRPHGEAAEPVLRGRRD